MKVLAKIYTLLCVVILISSCKKSDDNLEVDLSKYNPDITTTSELDKWISKEFTDPYNIEVVYRFNRDLGNTQRDISPVALENVTPIMNAVLDVYLKPYEKVAGKTFIKSMTPKQFVLFGSVSFNTNGSVTLGTADGGRRVVLYDVNNFDEDNGNNVKRDMRTIHHEFTHIVNQNVQIPQAFGEITKADYVTDWTNADHTEAIAKELGFISRYARNSFGEDFAEMASHLLVEGQIWFDNYLATAPNIDAVNKLRKKEQIVINYFKEYFDIDFKALQIEVQRVLKEKYKVTDPEDLSKTFASLIANNKVASIKYDTTQVHYQTHGESASFKNIYRQFVIAGSKELADGRLKWTAAQIPSVELRFTDSRNVVFRVAFKQNAASTTDTFFADFLFNMNVNTGNSEVTFVKSRVNGLLNNGNGDLPVKSFESIILPYLSNRTFKASFLPSTIPSASSDFNKFGGFSVLGDDKNFIYGPIVLK